MDIAYVLGHNQRRIHAESKSDGVHAQAYLDKQVVEEGAIDREHYAGFLKKAATFIDAAQKAPFDHPACRTPFTVTVRIGDDTRITHGCRSSDETAISHLVRDGEFLLSSKRN